MKLVEKWNLDNHWYIVYHRHSIAFAMHVPLRTFKRRKAARKFAAR